MCSETSPRRLSFSHDSEMEEVLPMKLDQPQKGTLPLDPNSEFEFSISSTLEFESSSADELFSNGVILPIQIRGKTASQKNTRSLETPYTKLPPRPCCPRIEKMKKESSSMREVQEMSSDYYEGKSQSKSFWGFSRSKSLNCDTKKKMICPFPLLSRSNSTGSVPKPKRMSTMDENKHNRSRKPSSSNFYSVPRSSSGKSYGGSHGRGLGISPALNVPASRISKGSANFLGLGSFLRVGTAKKSNN